MCVFPIREKLDVCFLTIKCCKSYVRNVGVYTEILIKSSQVFCSI